MVQGKKIGVVIPAFRVKQKIAAVVGSVPCFVDHIFITDDCCPEGSGKEPLLSKTKNLSVLFNPVNTGVGGAVQRGYRAALDAGCDIIVKIDGDGQMDPRYMEALIAPIVAGRADYTKGNRFYDFKALACMPGLRLLGNIALSFLVKIASGYWKIFDPTNGYTAISRSTLARVIDEKIARRYFFESDMLIHLGIKNAVVEDVRIPAVYGNERSSLRIPLVLIEFPPRLLFGFLKRIFYRYFDFNFDFDLTAA